MRPRPLPAVTKVACVLAVAGLAACGKSSDPAAEAKPSTGGAAAPSAALVALQADLAAARTMPAIEAVIDRCLKEGIAMVGRGQSKPEADPAFRATCVFGPALRLASGEVASADRSFKACAGARGLLEALRRGPDQAEVERLVADMDKACRPAVDVPALQAQLDAVVTGADLQRVADACREAPVEFAMHGARGDLKADPAYHATCRVALIEKRVALMTTAKGGLDMMRMCVDAKLELDDLTARGGADAARAERLRPAVTERCQP
jgi:hypothetical protein